MHTQIKRVMQVLQVLNRAVRPLTVQEISRKTGLNEVSNRTLQRDLKLLSDLNLIQFKQNGVERPYQWVLPGNTSLAGLSDEESLCLILMQTYMKQLLPPEVYDLFSDSFNLARNRLSGATTHPRYARWLKKIRVIETRGTTQAGSQDTVKQALFENRQLSLEYQTSGGLIKTFSTRMPVNPLGLIKYHDSWFLVAAVDSYQAPVVMAMDRIHSPAMQVFDCIPPASFNLDQFIDSGYAFEYLLDNLPDPELPVTIRQRAAA